MNEIWSVEYDNKVPTVEAWWIWEGTVENPHERIITSLTKSLKHNHDLDQAANARLIAAAPRLLEAARAAFQLLDTQDDHFLERSMEELAAAIHEATEVPA